MPSDELRILIAEMGPLDAPLRQLAGFDLSWKSSLISAPLDSFERIIEQALEQSVDAVVFTGTLLSKTPTYAAVKTLEDAVEVLSEEGIRAIYAPAVSASGVPAGFSDQLVSQLPLLRRGEVMRVANAVSECEIRLAGSFAGGDFDAASKGMDLGEGELLLFPSKSEFDQQSGLRHDGDQNAVSRRLSVICGMPAFEEHSPADSSRHVLNLGPAIGHRKPEVPTVGQGVSLLRFTEDSGWDIEWIPTATVQRIRCVLDLDRLADVSELADAIELESLSLPAVVSSSVRFVDWEVSTKSFKRLHAISAVLGNVSATLGQHEANSIYRLELAFREDSGSGQTAADLATQLTQKSLFAVLLEGLPSGQLEDVVSQVRQSLKRSVPEFDSAMFSTDLILKETLVQLGKLSVEGQKQMLRNYDAA